MNKEFIETFTIEGEEHNYVEFLESVENHFNFISGTPLFKTNVEGLYELFLDNLPQLARQHYTCRACKHFIERFGGLVTIMENGVVKSAIWHEEVPIFFQKSVKAMKKAVERARVTDVFISDERVLGTPITGQWKHLSVKLPISKVNRSRLKNASQMMAEKREDFRILIGGLLEYPIDTVEQALALLQSETLYRSDKVLGVAEFLKDLHTKRANAKNSQLRDNITWLAVAKAPTGYCHVKSSMIGTLLEDINDGLSTTSISRRFAEKMSPSNYMRSQSTPTENTILQAERTVEKLGIANSLGRRYARFEEVPEFLWKGTERGLRRKTVAIEETSGVFGHLTPKKSNNIDLPSTVMTFEKFKRTLLPSADKIEVKVDNTNRLMALVTALDENAENILQWNNTFSWYYHGGIDGEIKRRVESAGGRYDNNEIRVSLIWEGYTDLDLHCITPRGEHIGFSHKRGRCGGWLDIDMNGGSHRDASPVENIRWSSNAPQGHYKFYVHNYQERGKGSTPFTVELEINGKTYTHHGVASGTGFEHTVFSFDYRKGEQLTIKNGNYTSDGAWNISTNDFVGVKGITTSPNLWGNNNVEHAGTHIFFLLDECKDLEEGKGRGFFNEMLKPELREIRKTLELYTANTPIEDVDIASACGVGYTKDNEWNLIVRVTSGNSTRLVKIDRWD